MTAPWDSDALWMKAKLFINHAMDDEPREFDERALWASLSLELLAKSALAQVSPLLIAEPNEDGKNLLAAAGLFAGTPTFRSIKAHTLFKRCATAFRPFNDTEAIKIANNRNDYIHAASAEFAPVPEAAWWPSFWTQAAILVEACHQDLDAFVGSTRVPQVEARLAQHTRNVEERVEALVARARRDFARFLEGNMLGSEAQLWERPRDRSAGLAHHVTTTCPSCGSTDGLLEGDEVIERDEEWERYSESDYGVTVMLKIGTSYFSCDTCHLVLDGYELIEVSGLDVSIDAEGDMDDGWNEPDYGND